MFKHAFTKRKPARNKRQKSKQRVHNSQAPRVRDVRCYDCLSSMETPMTDYDRKLITNRLRVKSSALGLSLAKTRDPHQLLIVLSGKQLDRIVFSATSPEEVERYLDDIKQSSAKLRVKEVA
jgi:hypothetical protein